MSQDLSVKQAEMTEFTRRHRTSKCVERENWIVSYYNRIRHVCNTVFGYSVGTVCQNKLHIYVMMHKKMKYHTEEKSAVFRGNKLRSWTLQCCYIPNLYTRIWTVTLKLPTEDLHLHSAPIMLSWHWERERTEAWLLLKGSTAAGTKQCFSDSLASFRAFCQSKSQNKPIRLSHYTTHTPIKTKYRMPTECRFV